MALLVVGAAVGEPVPGLAVGGGDAGAVDAGGAGLDAGRLGYMRRLLGPGAGEESEQEAGQGEGANLHWPQRTGG